MILKYRKELIFKCWNLKTIKIIDLNSLIIKRIILEEGVDVFKFYDQEKLIKIIIEPKKKIKIEND
jgi:hypothetical protein